MNQLKISASLSNNYMVTIQLSPCNKAEKSDCGSSEEIFAYFKNKKFFMVGVQNFIDLAEVESEDQTLKQLG